MLSERREVRIATAILRADRTLLAAQENRFKPDSHKLRYLASMEDLRTKADRLRDILYNGRRI